MSSRVLACANGSDSDAILRDKKHRRRPGFGRKIINSVLDIFRFKIFFFYKSMFYRMSFQDSYLIILCGVCFTYFSYLFQSNTLKNAITSSDCGGLSCLCFQILMLA